MKCRGAILLEAMVGLALLSTAGIAAIGVVKASLVNEQRLSAAEAETERADRLLAGWALLTGAELARRVGATPAGEFVVVTTRPEPNLYRMTVVPVEAPDHELLVTVVHRPDGVK